MHYDIVFHSQGSYKSVFQEKNNHSKYNGKTKFEENYI